MWVRSAEFALKFGLNKKSLEKSCFRAILANKKFCSIKSNILVFSHTHGKGGKSGRVLMIWDKPFESEGEAAEFALSGEAVSKECLLAENGKAVETPKNRDFSPVSQAQNDRVEVDFTSHSCASRSHADKSAQNDELAQNSQNTHPQTPSAREGALMARNDENSQNEIPQNRVKFKMQSKVSQQKQRNLSMQKMALLKDYEVAKKGKVSVKHFIESVNSRKNYSFEVTQNKLFAWQRAFKNSGLEGLCDTRGGRTSSLLSNEHKDLIDELIKATRGRVNISSMHRLFHANLANVGKCDFEAFLAKEQEIVSYGVIERYVKAFFKANPFYKKLIEKGEDGAVSAFLPALGVANYNVTSINQIVEIDATSIDAIIDTSALAAQLGIEVENIEQWQKRFVLIALIDTFSGVCSFHISDTENSLGVSRAIAKYIMKYGKPIVIKSDNGSAFISKYIQEVLARLDIEHKRTPAYSGWCKPFVERNFGRLQNHLMEWIKGYIGHSVSQRQAIEFFFSRQQRRLKRGQKSNQKDLHTLSELGVMIDEYADSFMNNAYLERINKTPTQAYNERVSEAVAMNEYDLMSRLSPLERRAVGKKGIAWGGLFFYSTKIYEFSSVLVAANINNTKELFVYDENGAFVDIARELDTSKGVTAEEAKRARKHFKKRLKEAKDEMARARAKVELETPLIYAELAKKMPKTKTPKKVPLNNELLESARLKSEALKRASGDEFVNSMSELADKISQPAPQTPLRKGGGLKRDLSWESAVLNLNKEQR